MQYGSSESKVFKRERWFRNAELQGDCPHCKPHRGENWRRSHKRYRNALLVDIKGKDRK
jgi:hypothetical protein